MSRVNPVVSIGPNLVAVGGLAPTLWTGASGRCGAGSSWAPRRCGRWLDGDAGADAELAVAAGAYAEQHVFPGGHLRLALSPKALRQAAGAVSRTPAAPERAGVGSGCSELSWATAATGRSGRSNSGSTVPLGSFVDRRDLNPRAHRGEPEMREIFRGPPSMIPHGPAAVVGAPSCPSWWPGAQAPARTTPRRWSPAASRRSGRRPARDELRWPTLAARCRPTAPDARSVRPSRLPSRRTRRPPPRMRLPGYETECPWDVTRL